MLTEGKVHMSEADGKLLQALREDSNKAFRELHYHDFMRDVLAVESLINRYKQPNP